MGADNAHYRPFLIISTMSALPKTDAAPAKLISVILVRKGMKDRFLEWSGRVAEALNAAPGFTSREVIPPQNDDLKEWVFVNRFDSIEHLRAWRDGGARKLLCDRSYLSRSTRTTWEIVECRPRYKLPSEIRDI
jgi:antibiotic biosynthesis monooxygenase (ABM) superfamily enzyme